MDTGVLTVSGFISFIAIVGFLANSLVIVTNAGTLTHPSTSLLLFLCCADLLLSVNFIIFSIPAIYYNFYFWDSFACKVNYYLTLASCAASLLGVSSIAIERYLATNYLMHLPKKAINLWVGLMVILSLLGPSLPFYLKDPEIIGLEESGFLCNLNWSKSTPATQTMSWFIIATMMVCILVMMTCYYKVYRAYVDAVAGSQRKRYLENQKQILKRCVIISLTYSFFWSFEFGKMMYNVITRQRTGPLISTLGGLGTALNATANPFLMMTLDNRIRSNALRGLWKSSSNEPDSDSETTQPPQHSIVPSIHLKFFQPRFDSIIKSPQDDDIIKSFNNPLTGFSID